MAVSNLSSSIESWGAAKCTNETGEPAKAMLASAAGFSAVSPAPFLPARFGCMQNDARWTPGIDLARCDISFFDTRGPSLPVGARIGSAGIFFDDWFCANGER